ncbi:unnamed protein product [Ectocarpus sp. 6 AP-2014]
MELATFIREPLPLSLLAVPGIDQADSARLASKGIFNTHQLIGQFLLFHARDVDAEQLQNRFKLWLSKLGVQSDTAVIAGAVAEKASTWVDGVHYTDCDYWDLCSETG